MTEDASKSVDSQPDDFEKTVRERLGTHIEGVGTLQAIVGIGGMATVYSAETSSGASVAVKLMHEHLADKGSLRRRFIREAKILGQVDHPNAITVYDRGSASSGEAYFVMELLDGWEVETVWKKQDRQFPVEGALEVGVQGLDCLHAYHGADVLHRDLKPSNLFLTREGVVKLIDFGVARFRDRTSERTRAGTALGTPAYMAPEQAMGKVEILDARTDVYGFGAVLFTLLSGERVHEAETNDETLVMAATQPADSLAQHAPDVPAEVVQIVDRAVSWDPEDRFETADAMRAAIAELIETFPGELERRERGAAEEIEGTEHALDRDAADDVVDIDDRSIEGMEMMFERLEHSLNAARIYGWEHDKTTRNIEHTYEAFRETIDREHGEVFWKVRPHSFEIDGEPLWNAEEPFELVPYNLFLDGFRRLQLRSSMLLEEFIEFAEWLTLDPHRDLPPEDDLATALWDMALPSVDAKVVTAPTMIDPDGDDLLLEDAADDLMDRAASMMEDGAGKRLLVAMRTGAYAEANAMMDDGDSESVASGRLGQDFTVAERGLVGSSRLEQLSGAIDREKPDWESRIERVFGDIWGGAIDLDRDSEFVEVMQDVVELYVDSGRLDAILRILLRSYRRLESPAERRFFLEHILDDERVDALTDAVRRATPAAPEDPDAVPGVVDRYRKLLEILPDEHLDLLLDHMEHDHRPLRRAISRYLHRRAQGRVSALAEKLRDLDLAGGKLLLKIIATVGGDQAFDVLAAELDRDDPELRRRAVELLNRHFDLERDAYDLSDQIVALLDDPDEQLRLAALRLGRNTGTTAVVPAVADRATDSAFNSLSIDERREVLQTLAVLSRPKAQEIACELAEHHGVMPGDERQRTRVLALRILGEIGESERALEAAETGTGGWWWNSDEVRDAAETAYEQIERRTKADA